MSVYFTTTAHVTHEHARVHDGTTASQLDQKAKGTSTAPHATCTHTCHAHEFARCNCTTTRMHAASTNTRAIPYCLHLAILHRQSVPSVLKTPHRTEALPSSSLCVVLCVHTWCDCSLVYAPHMSVFFSPNSIQTTTARSPSNMCGRSACTLAPEGVLIF